MAFRTTCDVPGPGLVDFEGQNSEEELGYIPKNVSRIGKVISIITLLFFIFSFRHGIFCALLYMVFCLSATVFLRTSHHIGGIFLKSPSHKW